MIRPALLCLALLAGQNAAAMPPPNPEMRAAHLTRALGLSEAQHADLLVLLQHQAEAARAAHCRDRDARQQRRLQHDAEIEALLSESQRQRFVELRRNRPAPPAGRGPCGPGLGAGQTGGEP